MCDSASSYFLLPSTDDTIQHTREDYESQVTLPSTCLEELSWWDTQMCKWNGKSILKMETDMIIDSDASLMGWGDRCKLQTTGGLWSEEEAEVHMSTA